MDPMDAWSVFLNTGNVLDYLKNSDEYFDPDKGDSKKITGKGCSDTSVQT